MLRDVRCDRIVLIGTMGAGKSTVGRALAARLGWAYRDNDTALRARAGRSAAEVLAAEGEARLHELEAEVLAASLAEPGPAVVSAPGSVAAYGGVLAGETVVWLRARPETLAARVAGSSGRPFPEEAAARDVARRPAYEALATLVVDTDDTSVEEVVETIVRLTGASGS